MLVWWLLVLLVFKSWRRSSALAVPGLGFTSLFSAIWGLVTILFGWGLWRMRYWAWLGTVIVLGIKILFALFALFGPASIDWIGTIISLIVLVYLITPNVRLFFID